MKITKVTVEHYDRGIPLKGWDSVKSALNLYASGAVKGSHATENEQAKAVGQSFGALGLGLYLVASPHMQGVRNSFVERMTDEAHETLQERDHWSRHCDYDGQGVFFKTSVEITVLDRKEELYMLEINAAYVGSAPESELAEELGIPRALRYYMVTAEIKSEDGLHFAFDFEEALRAVDGVLKTDSLKGVEIANTFMAGDRFAGIKPVQIFFGTGISVTVAPGRVERRYVYNKTSEAHQDTWTIEGPVLYGLLDSSYVDESRKEPPTIIFTVTNAQRDHFGYSLPIWDADQKDRIDILSHQIAEALNEI